MKHTIKTKICSITLGSIMAVSLMAPRLAAAGAEPFVGELMLFGGTYCPRDWANADGQLLAISQYQSLFALYGTTYGGDGRTSFALPDLRGRSPINLGQGPGLANYTQGQRGGAESVSVQTANMPSHNHIVNGTNAIGNLPGPGSDFLAKADTGQTNIYHNGPANVTMDPGMIANTGGSQPISKRSPYLTMRWCVALQGIFPPRN